MASSAPDHLRTPGLISNRPCYEGIKFSFYLECVVYGNPRGCGANVLMLQGFHVVVGIPSLVRGFLVLICTIYPVDRFAPRGCGVILEGRVSPSDLEPSRSRSGRSCNFEPSYPWWGLVVPGLDLPPIRERRLRRS